MQQLIRIIHAKVLMKDKVVKLLKRTCIFSLKSDYVLLDWNTTNLVLIFSLNVPEMIHKIRLVNLT